MQTLIQTTRAYALVKNEKQRGTLGHAYLLVMDDESNLRSALKAFAKLFFGCDEPKTDGESRVARLIDQETFSDCLFFPKDEKKFVVEDVDLITEESTLKPVEGDQKTFIIDNFALSTPAAQNKLLKLLEEPPQGVRFLIGTTSVYPVLSTVLSRVKILEVPPFAQDDIRRVLERENGSAFPADTYALCAAMSGGSLGAAKAMLLGGAYQSMMDEAFSLVLAEERQLPALIKKSGESKQKKQLITLMRTIWRDALILKTAQETGAKTIGQSVLLKAEYNRLQKLAQNRSLSSLVFAQEACTSAEKEITFNAYFPQCLEVLLASVLRENKRI
jgi:DNA polymerase III gamma/tau subunit